MNDPTASTGLFEMIYEKEIEFINNGTFIEKEEIKSNAIINKNLMENTSIVEETPNTQIIDETSLFEQAIQTYNDKIIEVSC